MSVSKGIVSVFTLILLSHQSIAGPGELKWTGCDISLSAYAGELAAAYEKDTGIPVNMQAGGYSSGIRDVQKGVADMGGATRYLLPDDPRETGVELIPVAWDALAIATHKDNPATNISLDQLKAVYRGEITNWSTLGGAEKAIEVFGLGNSRSDAEQSLRDLLFSDTSTNIAVSRVFDSTASLEQALADTPQAIAITGIGDTHGGYKTLTLDNVAASIATIKSGDYGLYRPLYIAYNPSSPNVDAVKKFIGYVNGKTGRDVLRRNGVIPYREAMSLVMRKVRENEADYPQGLNKSD